METPKYYEFMNPTLQAMRNGGGTLTNQEIVDAVGTLMQLPDDVLDRQQHGHNVGEVTYRIAWAKSYLKKAGYLTQSERGVWALTPQGKAISSVDERAIVSEIRQSYAARRKEESPPPTIQGVLDEEVVQETLEAEEIESELSWIQRVIDALLSMTPEAFERLSQRLLRESGFTQVEVTSRSRDGGIDGKGVLRLASLLNFQVVFQSKRYVGTVGASIVRDFRGAMIGRADKGLIITTGTFTRDARNEAIRDGAPVIDLVDGQELAWLLKKFNLGVRTVMVEQVEVDSGWFESV